MNTKSFPIPPHVFTNNPTPLCCVPAITPAGKPYLLIAQAGAAFYRAISHLQTGYRKAAKIGPLASLTMGSGPHI